MTQVKTLARAFFVLILFLLHSSSQAQKLVPPPVTNELWSKDYEPFRIAGNLYYVGSYDLACYLIKTSDGLILINSGLAESAPMIRSHIEKLGFNFSDIKILLTQQVHFDHVAAMAEIKELTHAKLMVDEKDVQVMEDGGNSDYYFGGKGALYRAAKVDRGLRDNDTIRLGDTKLTMLHHPGHTKGSCSYLLDVKDENRNYKVLIANMPTIIADPAGMPGYPDITKDYAYTLRAMKSLSFDIWVATHASLMDMHTKHKPGDLYNPLAFADREGYDKMIGDIEKDFLKRTRK